jgi:cytochrome c5
MNANHAEDAHPSALKNPNQLLSSAIWAVAAPIAAVIGVVAFFASGSSPVNDASLHEKAVAGRIQKVGMVHIREASKGLQSGEAVYKAQCSVCHATGVVGAPKFGDASAWGVRIKTGFNALLHSAIAGKGSMGAQGGGAFKDIEIARAIVYMTSAAGGKFPEPVVPTSEKNAASPAPTPVPAATQPPPQATVPVTTAAPVKTTVAAATPVANGAGEALYKQACQVCHAAGVAGAPKFGDKAAWAPRIQAGIKSMYATATTGKGAMPARGGTTASDTDLHAAVDYMAAAAQ